MGYLYVFTTKSKKTVVISVIADKKNAGHLQQQQMRTDLNHTM